MSKKAPMKIWSVISVGSSCSVLTVRKAVSSNPKEQRKFKFDTSRLNKVQRTNQLMAAWFWRSYVKIVCELSRFFPRWGCAVLFIIHDTMVLLSSPSDGDGRVITTLSSGWNSRKLSCFSYVAPGGWCMICLLPSRLSYCAMHQSTIH